MKTQTQTAFLLPIIITILTISGCAGEQTHLPQHPIKDFFLHRTSENEVPEEEGPEQHLHLKITDSGYDVFTPTRGVSFDYRYGPSVMLHDDGSMDAWFAIPGDGVHEMDWVTYRHSDDSGKTWSDEKVVISPTPGSKDELSICDPDVFYYDGYYYLGYTSTMDITKQGLCNSFYLARSPQPDGPFEKWDGAGWGGDPEPVIYYDGVWNGWGVGEPGFVLKDDTLYIYVTDDAYTYAYDRLRTTEVYKADILEPDWPARLSFAGYAIDRSDTDTHTADATGTDKDAGITDATGTDAGTGTDIDTDKDSVPPDDYVYCDCDSWDVAYVEEAEKFIAVCTNRRFTDDSCILYYESDDGIYFERVSELNTNVICGCHNCCIMSNESGHINAGDPVMIGYSYAGAGNSEWGTWATRFAPGEIELTDTVDRSEDKAENLKKAIEYKSPTTDPYPIIVTGEELSCYAMTGSSTFNLAFRWIDENKNRHGIKTSDIEFTDYDSQIISEKDGLVSPSSPGKTHIDIHYKNLSRKLCLYVLPADTTAGGRSISDITDLFSPADSYTLSISLPYATQIRPLVTFRDYSFAELSLEDIVSYGLSFTSSDTSVCEAGPDGMLIPLSAGDADIVVSCGEGLSYRVPVHVVE